MHSAPATAFLAAHGLAPAGVAAAGADMGLDAAALLSNLTVTGIQAPLLSPLTAQFVPLFDVELTARLLAQINQNGLSMRLGPVFRAGGDGTLTEGFFILPLFTTFVTTTVQQLAALGAAGLRVAAAVLRRDLTTVRAEAAATAALTKQFFAANFGPTPASIAIALELVLRDQLSVNGGDIAAVV